MKYSIILLFAVLIFSCNREFDMLPPEVKVFPDLKINCGDTISLPIDAKMRFSAYSDNKNTTYYWNFGDGNYATERDCYHSYASKGLYPVSVKVNNGDKEGECGFFVRVFGQRIGKKSDNLEGLWLLELSNDNYIFTRDISSYGMFLHKLNGQNELFMKQPQYFYSYSHVIDLKLDKDNNFIIMEVDGFAKIDLNGNTLFKKSASGFDIGRIYETELKDYLLIGKYNDMFSYEKRDNSGIWISKSILADDNFSNKTSLDGMFINDIEYLMLFVNGEYNYYSNDSINISISKNNLENENEIELTITNVFCERLLNTSSGYLLFGLNRSIGSLNIVKISSDLEFEWHQRIYFGDESYDWNFEYKLHLREYADRYLFIKDNKLIILSKEGAFIKESRFVENADFQVNSICTTDQNTLILATVRNFPYSDLYEAETFPILFKIDAEGQIIE